MREAAEMASPTSDYFAAPLEDNLFEWHFTVRGPEDTDFAGSRDTCGARGRFVGAR